MKVLVTGAAGFIGFHLTKYLSETGNEVVGFDNINNYYDVRLKLARLEQTGIGAVLGTNRLAPSRLFSNYRFIKSNLEDRSALFSLFETEKFDAVCHLAAQVGIRYSLENPYAYLESNLLGFLNIAEACRQFGVGHLLFAGSSSVYGLNNRPPFSTHDKTDSPISFYAVTKKSNELTAHYYSHVFRLPATGLRFFTVYGPWGRPDMAYFKFAQKISAGEPIDLYNNGDMARDFTYIADVVEGIAKLLASPPESAADQPPFRIFNMGNRTPVRLNELVAALENALGKKAVKNFLPLQPGDVVATCADTGDLEKIAGFSPQTPFAVGIRRFVDWYNDFYGKR